MQSTKISQKSLSIYLNRKDVCSKLGISDATLRRRMASGKIPRAMFRNVGTKFRENLRVNPEIFEKWLSGEIEFQGDIIIPSIKYSKYLKCL